MTGTLFFVPTTEFLENQPAGPEATGLAVQLIDSEPTATGSLGIGALRVEPNL